MLVQIQSSALWHPDSVADRIGLSEGPGPGSTPGRDIELCLASVPDSTAAFEAARRGSIPRQGTNNNETVLGVCRIRTRPCEGRGPGSIPGEDTATCFCETIFTGGVPCIRKNLKISHFFRKDEQATKRIPIREKSKTWHPHRARKQIARRKARPQRFVSVRKWQAL
jgi:hypothetical protein